VWRANSGDCSDATDYSQHRFIIAKHVREISRLVLDRLMRWGLRGFFLRTAHKKHKLPRNSQAVWFAIVELSLTQTSAVWASPRALDRLVRKGRSSPKGQSSARSGASGLTKLNILCLCSDHDLSAFDDSLKWRNMNSQDFCDVALRKRNQRRQPFSPKVQLGKP
jgi:hypothetical protein